MDKGRHNNLIGLQNLIFLANTVQNKFHIEKILHFIGFRSERQCISI